MLPALADYKSFEPDYRQFFDLEAAFQDVMNHVKLLPSMLNDPNEQHTRIQYRRNLRHFIDYLNECNALPTESLMIEYVAYLRESRQLATSTITTYLAPVRLFCHFLSGQAVDIPVVASEDVYGMLLKMQVETGIERTRLQIARAGEIKNLRATTTTHKPEPHGKWISEQEFYGILEQCNPYRLDGKRDRAILLVGYWTGLRRAAIARLTLANFARETSKTYSCNVMDKRRNFDRIAVPKHVFDAIQEYAQDYNAYPVAPITDETRLWRRITRSGTPYPSGESLSTDAIYRIISRLSSRAGVRISPHDLRRSTITNALEKPGAAALLVQEQVRHESFDTTMRYKKRSINWDGMNLYEITAS